MMANGLRDLNRSQTFACCVVYVTTPLGNLTFRRGASSSQIPHNKALQLTAR
jgi:hypothetical protein